MLINGKNYDWSNLVLILLGVPVVGVTAITYGITQDKKMNYGIGNKPVSYGTANKVPSGSFTFYKDEIFKIAQAAPNGTILDIPPFNVILMFNDPVIGRRVVTIEDVLFTADPFTGNQNDSQFMVTIPFVFSDYKTR